MNFNELYDRWQAAPFSNVGVPMPSMGLAIAALAVLLITLLLGGRRTLAWRWLGLAASVVLALGALLVGVASFQLESPAEKELRTELAQDIADQGWVIPRDDNNSYLWHELHDAGSTEVDTRDGLVTLKLNPDGSVTATAVVYSDEG